MVHGARLVQREVEPRSSHVSAADGLNLLRVGVLGLVKEGVELADDLVQKPQDRLAVLALLLFVVAVEVDNGGEDHAHALVVLGELARLAQLEGDVWRNDVEEQPLGLRLPLSGVPPSLGRLHPADKAEADGHFVHPVHDCEEYQDEQEENDGFRSQMSGVVVDEIGLGGVRGEVGVDWGACGGYVIVRELLDADVKVDHYHHDDGHGRTEESRYHLDDVAHRHKVDAADQDHYRDKERHLDVG